LESFGSNVCTRRKTFVETPEVFDHQYMSKDFSFEVDVFDKKAIRDKLPALQTQLEERRRELAELEERYQQLRRWAGFAEKEKADAAPSSSIEEVVAIIERAGRPMRSREVVVEMGPEAKRDTAAWAMWAAEGAGLIQRVSKGLYAPIDYQPSLNGDEEKKD
jgi:hypothetical protein